jgi:hypothetical protein
MGAAGCCTGEFYNIIGGTLPAQVMCSIAPTCPGLRRWVGSVFAATICAVIDAILQDHFNVGSGTGFVLGPLVGRAGSQAIGLRRVAGRILYRCS